MRIAPPGSPASSQIQGTDAPGKAAKSSTQFSGVLGAQNPQTTATSQTKIADLMKDLTSLANDMRLGKITKEELSRQFVGLVIEKRINLGQFTKDVKTIETAVADIVEQDPKFVSLLESQLKKLGTT
jgi:hypothetical protein